MERVIVKELKDIHPLELVSPHSWAMGVLYSEMQTTKNENLKNAVNILSGSIVDEVTFNAQIGTINGNLYKALMIIEHKDKIIKQLREEIETLKNLL